jgi:putative CocE/NonD family hydrolase
MEDRMNKRTILALLGLTAWGLYRKRRALLARRLGLSPSRYDVEVTRDIAVPMPDGVQLLADHFAPQASGDFPTVLIRTPYGRGGEVGLMGQGLSDFPAQRFAERGYHVLVQGARGCFASGGEFNPHVNEAADGKATLDWIAEQPWFNGALGTWGASYLGYTQWAVAASESPLLKAMLPSITGSQNFGVSHPDGAFGLETRLRWAQGIHSQAQGQPWYKNLLALLSGAAERRLEAAFMHLPLLEADTVAVGEPIPFYRDMLTHDQPGDAFWRPRDHSDAVARVKAPAHFIGGWYDYYLRDLLQDYAILKAAGQTPHLTIGPWFHAQPAGLMTQVRLGLEWFEAHLKGEQGRLRSRPVRLYVMGADQWREWDEWPPPAQEARYFLHADARLAPGAPSPDSAPDHYSYDPLDPTPALGGATLGRKGAGPQDNRALEARPDVLCYTTPPLTEDLTVVGPVRLELFARSSLAYTDFVGRLCDVEPVHISTSASTSVNICDGLFRVEPGQGQLQPDGSLRIEVDMWATAHCFRRGHCLRLQVCSGAHPRWSRNLGSGEPLATGARMSVARQSIYHDAEHPSALVLPLV